MAKERPVFLKVMPDNFISNVKGDDSKLRVRIPGDDGMTVLIDADQRFASADANGNPIAKHSNIKLGAPGDKLEVTVEGEDGNPQRKELSVKTIAAAWSKNQAEYAEQKGPKVYLNGVSERMIHDTKIEIKDADKNGTGVFLKQVTVADPKSAPQPVRDKEGNIVPGQFRETGYGTFVVSPDAISPCGGKEGKVNIYLGHENDNVRQYQVFTGEFGEDGKGIYEKTARTAGEVKTQYEDDLAAFKAKMKEQEASKEAEGKGNDAPKGPGE